MRIIILGCGRVGSAMATDLAKDSNFNVTVADKNEVAFSRLQKDPDIQTIKADLADSKELKKLVSGYDLVVDAVPGFMGYQTFKTVIEAGRNIVDIAFFAEDPFPLDDLAKQNDVIAVMDCGVAPGMSNLLAAHVNGSLDKTESVLIYVGGLPVVREWPYEYKAGFSPVDVIEEYTRPARYVENGVLVTRPALSDPELMDFPGIGTLESFNTDGLRTIIDTIKAPNMKEKTLRYPGHIAKMAVLRETGFFSQEPVMVNGASIRPLDFTSQLLFPKWELKKGEADLTVMQIVVEGEKNNKKLRYTYDLCDYYNPETDTTSMARTTGYTATTAVRMIVAGLYDQKGISPPEFIGRDSKCVNFMLKDLAKRGIEYRETVSEVD
jgi:lysine 6-dehydrogenase